MPPSQFFLYEVAVCHLCKEDFETLDDATLHFATEHGIYIENVKEVVPFFAEYVESYKNEPETVQWSKDEERREKLRFAKVQTILSRHQSQQQEDNPIECLFCKNVENGTTKLIKHMYSSHNFNIGLADNLVDAREFIQLLRKSLNQDLTCLQCDQIFKDQPSLKNHMRKKNHMKLNPDNHRFDKYYISNYTGNQADDDMDDEDEDWDDLGEMDTTSYCLFENKLFDTPEKVLEHMKTVHGFDLENLVKGRGTFATIKLINFVRECTADSTCCGCGEKVEKLESHVNQCPEVVSLVHRTFSDIHLKPFMENDQLLGLVMDDDESDDLGVVHPEPRMSLPRNASPPS